MPDWTTIAVEGAESLLILMGLLLPLTFVMGTVHGLRGWRRSLAFGALFGLVAVGTVFTGLTLPGGAVVDLRNAVVATGTALGGPLAGAVAATTVLVVRLPLGGTVAAAVASTGLAFLCGWAWHRWGGHAGEGRQPVASMLLLGVAVAVVVGTFPALAVVATGTLEAAAALDILEEVLPLSLLLTPPAALLIALFLGVDADRRRVAMALADRTRALETADARLTAWRDELERLVDERTAALRESQERYQRLFERDSAAIVVLDAVTGRLEDANTQAARLFGHDRDALTGMHPRDLAAHPENTPDFLALLTQRQGPPPGPFLRELKRADGTIFRAEIFPGAYTVSGRRKVFGVIHDVTDRERHAAEVSRSHTALEEFAYAASHDLQEPLRTINSFVRLLDRKLIASADGETREFMALVIAASDRMALLIRDLLAYSRIQTKARPLVPLNTRACLDEALSNLTQAIAEAGAEVRIGSVPDVLGDHRQMVSLFQNLVGNSLKYRALDRPCDVEVSARTVGRKACISIADNGIGFDPEHGARVFQIFQRLHPVDDPRGGTGVGLSMCKKIAERHGGSISVTPRPGEGCTFTVCLPLAPTAISETLHQHLTE